MVKTENTLSSISSFAYFFSTFYSSISLSPPLSSSVICFPSSSSSNSSLFIYLPYLFFSLFTYFSYFSCPSSVPFPNICHVPAVLFPLCLNRDTLLQRLTFTLLCRAKPCTINTFLCVLESSPPSKNQASCSYDLIPHQIQASHYSFTYKITLRRRTWR